MKRRPWLALVPLVAFASAGIAAASGVRYNNTSSLPVGLWLVDETPAQIRRHDIVMACLPPWPGVQAQRGDCENGSNPVLKPVAAVEGDIVQVFAEGVAVNGATITRPAHPLRPLIPRMPEGVYRVQAGEVWLLTDYHPASFDSRYYGPVKVEWVRGHARPLLVID